MPSATILPLRDDRDAVAERVRLEHVVRRQEHRLPGRLQPGDHRAKLTGADRVDPDRRLVEEHDGGVVEQPPGDVEALAHPAGVALDPLLLAALEPDELQELGDPGALDVRVDAVELREVAEVVERGQPLVQAAVAAEDVPDPLPHPVGVLHDVVPEDARLPGGGEEQRDQHLDRRRLACAVRAQEPEELALADLEADAAHRLDLERASSERARRRAVGAVKVDCLDDGGHGATLATRWRPRRAVTRTLRHVDMSVRRLRKYRGRRGRCGDCGRQRLAIPTSNVHTGIPTRRSMRNEQARRAGRWPRAIVAAALAVDRRSGLVGRPELTGGRLQGTIKLRAADTAHRRRRLHRQRAALVGEVRREVARPKLRLKVQLVGGDTPVEKGPGEAQKVAQKFISDSQVAAVIGPATSGGVASASQVVRRGGPRAHLAVRDAIGADRRARSKRGASPVRSSASSPGTTSRARPTRTTWSTSSRRRRSSSSTSRSRTRSASRMRPRPCSRRRASTTIRLSTSVDTTTDYSSLVTRVPNDANVVFFPTQQPEDAQTFGQQLLEQGKRATMFGGDGTNNPPPSSCRARTSRTSPRTSAGSSATQGPHRRMEEGQPEGQPRLLRAPDLPRDAGRDDGDQEGVRRGRRQIKNRAAVSSTSSRIVVKNSILGGTFRFSKKNERAAEREVLHLPDPEERHVQARELAAEPSAAARPSAGPPPDRRRARY